MNRRLGPVLVLVLLLAAGVMVLVGESEGRVGLSSVFEIWGDVLRDADGVGLGLTRASTEEELRLGERALEAIAGSWSPSEEWQAYVSAVGQPLAAHAQREGIRYQFHAVDSPDINAFAMPGGQVFVLRGMLEFLQSEAELAAILGHEIAHVDLRHCVQRFQYELTMERFGVGELGRLADVARRLPAIGYSKQQELDADVRGLRYSIEAGYDPDAASRVFERLARHHGEQPVPPPTTPVDEVVGSLEQALGSYLDSHPDALERSRRLDEQVRRSRSELSGRSYYVGVRNLKQRIPRSDTSFHEESRTPG